MRNAIRTTTLRSISIRKYDSLVKRIAYRLTPPARATRALDTDDLVVEGHMAILEALSSYRGDGVKEVTWVATRVRQRMLDRVRALRLGSRSASSFPHSTISVDGPPEEEGPPASRMTDPGRSSDELVDMQRQLDWLTSAMQQMPPRFREVLRQRVLDETSGQDTGRALGVSAARISQLHREAVEWLRDKAQESHDP